MSEAAVRRLTELAQRAGSKAYAEGEWYVGSKLVPPYRVNPIVRVTRGGQFSWFSESGREKFFTGEFQVSAQSDRMGYRLTGPEISLLHPRELLSEAVTVGTVQVPANGQPIILMADCQTTGGYPKIAEVITADLPVLAQMRPGEKVRFQEVSVDEAQRLLREQERKLSLLQKSLALV
jgi:antagonist of KipI